MNTMLDHSKTTKSNLSNSAAGTLPLDIQRIREDFAILDQKVNGKPLIYLDNAATTQKPQSVLDALNAYYHQNNANIHRAVHALSQQATALYDQSREKIQKFLNAKYSEEIIFTRGATEAINLVAYGAAAKWLEPGDEVLISKMEHHSNIVPWQIACQRTGAVLKAVSVTETGELDLNEFEKLLSKKTQIVSLVHVSNALGTINPVKQLIDKAHRFGAKVLIDGAQSAAHLPVDIATLDADFYTLSGHKIYGPTGIGVLYGKKKCLEDLPPYQSGGDMIDSVTLKKTTYAPLPSKFEAGTPHIAGAVGLGAAIDYVQEHGLKAIAAHEHQLLERATQGLQNISGVRIIGTAKDKGAVVSFVIENPPVASLDIGQQLDLHGIAVRTGHHCCQPVMEHFGVNSTARASFALYNTLQEADAFVNGVQAIVNQARQKAPRHAHQQPNRASATTPSKAAGADNDHTAGAPAYPPASHPSVAQAASELEDLFDVIQDWPSRYEAIIDMGEKLAFMPESLKTEENFVRGCQSIVHIAARQKPQSKDTIEFLADSDANIVRGLIAVLQKIYNGQRAGEILDFDAQGFLTKLGFDNNLSMTRRNGLQAMVQRIRKVARKIMDEG